MVTFIIYASVTLIIAYIFSIRVYKSSHFNSKFDFWLPFYISTMVISLLFFALCLLLPYTGIIETENVRAGEVSILAMQDNPSLEGRSYLASGYVNGVNVYYFLYDNGRGGMVGNSVPFNKSTVYDTMGEPTHAWFSTRARHRFLENFFHIPQVPYYEFYIPRDSVKKDINIDLKG